ncbi:MAG: hypothetical protein HUU46_02015 [Candidatus Hydrogenedentes bacterium]|nr:hypothetical protein [Candidatus Hydrogenedentota bacterium]
MFNFHNPDYQIGRGETAESRLEFPFFAAIMLASAVALLIVHTYFQNIPLTVALAVSAMIFGLTILRVDIGVFFLVVAMLLSPEIDAGEVGIGNRALNVRYNDALIIVVFVGVLVKCAFEGRDSLWLPNPINSGIALYFGVCLLSSMYAYQRALPLFDTQEAFFTLLKMAEFYMIFVLAGNAIRSMKQVRQQTYLFFAVAMVVAVYAVCSRFFMGIQRVSAPFEQGGTEPNTLGGYLVLVMCIAGGLYTQAQQTRQKAALLAMIVVAFVPFLFTLSRASYLAFIAGVLALGIVARNYTTIGAVALVLILSPFIMPDDVKDRVNYTFQRGDGTDVTVAGYETGVQVDKSTGERLHVWKKVNYNLHVWPWLGGGVSWDRVLDSQYARVLIETGILGCVAFVFLQLQILRTTREAFRFAGNWFGRGISVGIFAGTIALIIHSLGTVSFIIVRIMEPYWFLVALAVIVRALAIEEFVRNRQREKQPASATATAAPKPAAA